MKAKAIVVQVLGLVFLAAELCQAVPYSDSQDFNNVRKRRGPGYVDIGDSSPFGMNHDLGFDRSSQSMSSGSLTIYYSQVSQNLKNEKWSVVVNGHVIGTLQGGPSSKWSSQTFNFSSDLIEAINGSSNPLKIELVESTKGSDRLIVDRFSLSWDVDNRSPGNPSTPENPGSPGNPSTPGNPGSPENPSTPGHPGSPPPFVPASGPGLPLPGGDGSDAPAPVPEPATMLLLGAGLGGLSFFRKKFRG